jgi:membrane protein DedA with SNARE-associated domain
MDWWDEVRIALQGLLDHHGALAAFVMILLEESGVPVPVPGDFLMLAVGVHARESRPPLWQALLIMEIATLVGASVLYFLSARAGRTLVYRYGRYIHLTEQRLDHAERWLRRRGALAIVLGRVTPGLRMATVIAFGVFGYPYWRFLPAMALGAFLYILLYTLLGYFFGPVVLDMLERVHLPLGLFGSLIPLVLIAVWVARARRGLHMPEHTEASTVDRRHRWRDGAVAGGLATLASTLALNVVVHLSGDLALLAPGELIEHARARFAVLAFVRVLGPVLLLAATPVFMAVGVFWGAVYASSSSRMCTIRIGLVHGLRVASLGHRARGRATRARWSGSRTGAPWTTGRGERGVAPPRLRRGARAHLPAATGAQATVLRQRWSSQATHTVTSTGRLRATRPLATFSVTSAPQARPLVAARLEETCSANVAGTLDACMARMSIVLGVALGALGFWAYRSGKIQA